MRSIFLLLLAFATRLYAQPLADATNLHAAAQAREKACPDAACRAKVVPDFEAALRAYEGYIARSPSAPDVIEAQFFRAEILNHKLKQPLAAADAYMIVGGSKAVGKLHEDALLSAIDLYFAGLDAKVGALDAKLLAAIDRYAELFPSSTKTVGIIFKVGVLHYKRARYDEAIARFAMIVTKFPKDPNALAAGDHMLMAMNKQLDYAALWSAANLLLRHPAFATQKDRLLGLRYEASVKLGDAEMNAGKFESAATLYLRAASEARTPKVAAQSTMNAGVMYEKARLPDRAIEQYLAIATRFPAEPLAPKALFTAAIVEERTLHYDRAADTYERFGVAFRTDRQAADALYNAGVLRRVLGQPERALAAFDRYATTYRDRADATRVALAAAEIREELGQPGAEQVYVALAALGTSHAAEARLGASRVAFSVGRVKQADDHITAVIKLVRETRNASHRPDANRHHAAALALRVRIAARLADRVALNATNLKASLATKTALIHNAERIVVEITALGDVPAMLSATRELGAMRESFVQVVLAFPPPANLSERDRNVFRGELDRLAASITEQTVALYLRAYEKAIQSQHYSTDTIAIRDALVRLGALSADPSARVTDPRLATPDPTWVTELVPR